MVFAHGSKVALPEAFAKEGGNALDAADAENLSQSNIDSGRPGFGLEHSCGLVEEMRIQHKICTFHASSMPQTERVRETQREVLRFAQEDILVSTDFEDVFGFGGLGEGAVGEVAGDGVELRGEGRVGSGEGDGHAGIAAVTDFGDELNGAEEGDVELLRGALGAAAGEDVDFRGGSGGR